MIGSQFGSIAGHGFSFGQRIELRWQARPTISLSLSYDRDVVPSFIGNFVLLNRLHAKTTFTLMGIGDLTLAALAAQLTHEFNDVIHAGDMRFR